MACDVRRIARALAALVLAIAAPASASPDDPEAEAPPPDDAWLTPIARAALTAAAVHEAERGYSTPACPRDLAGALALSCEHQQGRPCGNGDGLAAELDSAAGYGRWLSAAIRLRLRTGRDAYDTGFDVDRAHVDAELGPLAVALGRDVITIGPAARTQFAWGDNAPPLDQLRLATAHPLAIAPWLHVTATYVLGRLADPQTYPHTLVSIVRGELAIADRVQLGATQLLELGGDGAPHLGPLDFVLEHVRRRDRSASASDSSNRRVGLDASVRLDAFGGARLIYQVMFEDLRTQLASAIRYDADHQLALATRWLTVEWRKTGERSYEHSPRVTGFTHGGRVVGDPLGPGAHAVLVAGHVPIADARVEPWLEVAQLDSDRFAFAADRPIVRTAAGPSELRFRIGALGRFPLTEHLELAPEAAIEDVERFTYIAGARRINTLVRIALVWRPVLRAPPRASPPE